MDPALCVEYSNAMDIDGNGVITDEDVSAFITRYTYFDSRKTLRTMDPIIENAISGAN